MNKTIVPGLLAVLAALGIGLAMSAGSDAAAPARLVVAQPAAPTCATGSWQHGVPYPIPISQAAIVVVGTSLFSFGGVTTGPGGNTVTAAAYRLDPGSGSWTPLTALPEDSYMVAAVTDGSRIYLVVGGGAGTPDRLYRYDPATNQYTALHQAPTLTDLSGAVYLNGEIYRAGREANTPHVDRYDVASDTWAAAGTVATYHIAGDNPLLLAYGSMIYATASGTSTKTYRYDPASNTWDDAAVADLPTAHGTGAGGLVNGRWVIAGGFAGTPRSAAVVALDLAQPAAGWATLPDLPQPRSFLPGAGTGTALYVVGGQTNDANTPIISDTEVYQETTCPTATPCTGYSDVHPADYFYTAVSYLTQHNVISGYADCTFRPYTPTTRAQMVKIAVLGFARPHATPTPGQYSFADVPPAQPFFAVIETAAADQLISGYACGGPGEPCDSQHRPYFRPGAGVTRSQLAKIDVLAAGWTLQNPATGSFADVAPGSAFYPYVETAACHNVISGYACGGAGDPCDPQQRPYFRPGNSATRGQIAKIVYNSISAAPTCGATAVPQP